VLTDFERWPEFAAINETRASCAGAKLWVEQRYSILLVPLAHTTIYDLSPRDGRLTWRLDEEAPHDIAETRGMWVLLPITDGRETLVRYDARMSARRCRPWSALRDRSLEQMIAGLRTEGPPAFRTPGRGVRSSCRDQWGCGRRRPGVEHDPRDDASTSPTRARGRSARRP
jgi:hypothetical protein